MTVQLLTFKSIRLKLSVHMSQVMSCLFSIHIDELVGLEVYPYINDNNSVPQIRIDVIGYLTPLFLINRVKSKLKGFSENLLLISS